MHLEDPNLIGRAKAVFDGSQDSEGVVAFAFKVEHRIHHMLQHPRPCQGSFLGHMANDKDGDVIGLGQLHELSCYLSHLRD